MPNIFDPHKRVDGRPFRVRRIRIEALLAAPSEGFDSCRVLLGKAPTEAEEYIVYDMHINAGHDRISFQIIPPGDTYRYVGISAETVKGNPVHSFVVDEDLVG